jgi:glyoxylase I family protein
MINFRVRDLNAIAAEFRSAGISIEMDQKKNPNGRFASLYDPEGNPIEPWQLEFNIAES